MREAARANKASNPMKKETKPHEKEKAQGWQREAKMAAVGRARLETESLINSQKSRALYGEAGEKDIERRQRLFRAVVVREPDRYHARRDKSTSEGASFLKRFGAQQPGLNARSCTS